MVLWVRAARAGTAYQAASLVELARVAGALALMANAAACSHRAAYSDAAVATPVNAAPSGHFTRAGAADTSDATRNSPHRVVAAKEAPATLATERKPVDASASAQTTNAPRLENEPPQLPVRYAFHEPISEAWATKSAPAMKYANMAPWQCRKELAQRKLPFRRDHGFGKGIATSLRFTGPLHGVTFVAPGSKSHYGKLDCRLALVLDDLAALLERYDVVEVRVDNMYRPGAHLPGSRKRSQHNYGLAIDITSFELRDGRILDVEDDYAGQIGQPSCGPESTLGEPGEEAVLLRNILCDVARARIFHHMLTPNYDRAHHDHFHFDIKRDAKWFVLR